MLEQDLDRPGLGTALEFTRLGDPPPTPAQLKEEARRKAQEDKDWADYARGVMNG